MGNGCRVCSGRVATDDANLAILNPKLAKEWHPTKNGDLRPRDVLPKSEKRIWWHCSQEHEWQATPSNRSRGSGCPYCSGRRATKESNLQSKYPDLVKEWDHHQQRFHPFRFLSRYSKCMVGLCAKGHSWLAVICNRSKGSGCPICNRARPTLRKGTIAEMERTANAKGGKCLSSEYLGKHVKLRWQCEKGHQWESVPNNVLRLGSWCSVCARRR